jgi:hypothetical protein
MAPLQLNDINEDGSKPKQKRRRGPSKKESKNPEEAQEAIEVLSEKVSCALLFFVFSCCPKLNFFVLSIGDAMEREAFRCAFKVASTGRGFE